MATCDCLDGQRCDSNAYNNGRCSRFVGFEAGVPELYWSTSTRLRVFDLVRRQDYGIRVALSQLNAMA